MFSVRDLDNRNHKHPEPEWTTEQINMKQGDTTFVQCGWCEYAHCGTCRYGCYLSTSCSLLKSYGLGSNVYWDTPCIVKMVGVEDLDSVLESKRGEIESYRHQITRLEKQIKLIAGELIPSGTGLPCLPNNRHADHFENGSRVYVFIHGDPYDKKWYRGTVIPGYRSGDGCVSYKLDEIKESFQPDKGGWGSGLCVPSVMREKDFHYFKQHNGSFEMWLGLCDTKYNGDYLDIEGMLAAFHNTNAQ